VYGEGTSLPHLAYLQSLLVQSVPNAVVPPQLPSKPFCGLAIVGIAPAEDEILAGQCFVGPSGQVLNKCLEIAGVDRDACWVGNLIPCKLPNNRAPSRSEVALFSGPLLDSLRKVNPKVVLALGAEPTRAFFPDTDVQIMMMRSHVLECESIQHLQVVPSIHPAFVLRRDLPFASLLINDIEIARNLLQGIPRYRPWTYEVIRSIPELEKILSEHRDELMFIDTEATSTNPHTAELFMISFSFESDEDKGYVIHCPTKFYTTSLGAEELLNGIGHSTSREDVLPVFQKFNLRCGIFNLLYDYILLKRHGYTPNVVVDVMYAFTLIDENMPKSLPVLGSILSGIGPYTMNYDSVDLNEWIPYSACDAVNTVRVWSAMKKHFEDPTRKNNLFKYLVPVLKTLAGMSITGLGID